MSWVTVLIIAFGGTLALEGAAWAIFPSQMRQMYQEAFSMDDKALHIAGLVSVAVGVVMILMAVKAVSP